MIGGGIIGLSTAMLLSKQGHQVTVLERDEDPAPETAVESWGRWIRPTVRQFRQAHYLHPAARQLMERHLPDVVASLQEAGALNFDVLTMMPATVNDRAPRAGDDRFRTLTARRAVLEYAAARTAAPQVEIRRGSGVAGLRTSDEGGVVPRVTGVELITGETLTADVVVDASGRASRLPAWLEAIGSRLPGEVCAPSGFTYYTRYFRGDSLPAFPPEGLMSAVGSLTILTLPADAGTWSTTLVIASQDQALKVLRDPAVWTRVLAACPDHARWQEGEELSGVVVSAGPSDRIRRFVHEGVPVATGVVAVGDSFAYTDPTFGRGVTLGLMHAVATAEVIGQHLSDPMALALTHDEISQARVAPWHRNSVRISRTRSAEVRAAITGVPLPRADDVASSMNRAFQVAMRFDADLHRAYAEVATLQTLPHKVLSRPGLPERVLQVAAGRDTPAPAGPSRARLLDLAGYR